MHVTAVTKLSLNLLQTNGNPAFPQSYFFHSSDIGPTHSIFLSVYVDYTPGADTAACKNAPMVHCSLPHGCACCTM